MTSSDPVHNSFKYSILVMKIFGLYPFDNYPNWYKFHAALFYLLFTIPAPLLPIIHLIVTRERDMEKITECLFVALVSGICILKFLPFKIIPGVIERSIFTLNQDIFQNVMKDQKHFIRDTEAACRNIFIVSMIFYLLSLFSWPLRALIQEGRRFPIDIWLPFDPFENVNTYVGTFVYLFIATGNAPIGNAAIDSLMAGLINHAACQIRILKDTLHHLNQRVDEQIEKRFGRLSVEMKNKLKNDMVYKEICHNIEHYDAIYKFVKDFEVTFSFFIFHTFAVSCVVICMACFQLSIAEPLSATFFAMTIYVISLLLEIVLYCYYGTILYEESDTIIYAIYSSEWYNFDSKSKKALIILMERTKRPMQLTTGKLLDLSLTTWTKIIRRSYSLLAVLKNY